MFGTQPSQNKSEIGLAKSKSYSAQIQVALKMPLPPLFLQQILSPDMHLWCEIDYGRLFEKGPRMENRYGRGINYSKSMNP